MAEDLSDNSNATKIPLPALKAAVDAILDHLINDLGVKTVEIEPKKDFYYDFDTRVLYDMANKNPKPDIGRLTDDWEFLSKIIGDRDQAAGLMMMHAAPLLRYVGEKIGQ